MHSQIIYWTVLVNKYWTNCGPQTWSSHLHDEPPFLSCLFLFGGNWYNNCLAVFYLLRMKTTTKNNATRYIYLNWITPNIFQLFDETYIHAWNYLALMKKKVIYSQRYLGTTNEYWCAVTTNHKCRYFLPNGTKETSLSLPS